MRSTYRRLALGGVVLAVAVLSGCYTVLDHPRVAPEQQVTQSGTVIKDNQCAGCHTVGELWSYQHYRYGEPFHPVPSHASSISGSLVWDHYYYRYDPYFVRARWYGDNYYTRWSRYRHTPWWCCGDDDWTGGEPRPSAVGRGASRDGYDGNGPRTVAPSQSYNPNMGPASSMPYSPPGVIYTSPSGAASKDAAEEEAASSGRQPGNVRSRDGSTSGSATRVAPSGSSEPGTRARGSSATGSSDSSTRKPARDNSSDEDDNGREGGSRAR